MAAIPAVDWHQLESDRDGFLREVRHALGDIGFLIIKNAPGFEQQVQAQRFSEFHRFFDATADVKESASIARTPYMRGYDPIVQTTSQLVETYQYGPDLEPAVADHKDPSQPIWKRMFYGPQTWPDKNALPSFQGAIEGLCAAYLSLHHSLGELICESLGAPPGSYDALFDRDMPLPIAFVGRSYSLEHVRRGGLATNRQMVKSGDEGVKQMMQNIAQGAGSHVDITTFLALLTMDAPGLQVLAKGGEWVDMPVIPGAVCVNAGSELQHLAGGRMVATMHRVNTMLIPPGTTRVSCPFFLSPRFDVQLTPFGAPDQDGTDYMKQDRGMSAAFNRMTLFRPCTRRFWAEEFAAAKDEQRRLEVVENQAAMSKIKNVPVEATRLLGAGQGTSKM